MADAPVCALCSKPIRYLAAAILHLAAASVARGELVHLRCQVRAAGLKRLDTVDRSQAARGRAQAAVERARDLTEATQSPRPRKLVIIDRDHAQAYDAVRQRHGQKVPVMRDRRMAEQRQVQQPVPAERRSGRDRRRPLTLPEELVWREAGYRIAYRAAATPRTAPAGSTGP